jgi:hypothetical protein
MRPVDVDNEAAATKAWINLFYKDSCKQHNKPDTVASGQRARIARWKGNFEKGYMPNWSREHFVVRKRLAHPQPVYKIEDAKGEPIEGHFYEKELQAIPRQTLQVERIVRQRKRGNRKQFFVKWRGFSDKFNQWISNADLQKYKRTPADRARTHGGEN